MGGSEPKQTAGLEERKGGKEGGREREEGRGAGGNYGGRERVREREREGERERERESTGVCPRWLAWHMPRHETEWPCECHPYLICHINNIPLN